MKKRLEAALARLRAAHEAWVRSVDEHPGDPWYDAAYSAMREFSSVGMKGGLPDDCLHWVRPMVAIVDGWEAEDWDVPEVCRKLMHGVCRLIDAQPLIWPVREPIESLNGEPGMTPQQLAKMTRLDAETTGRLLKEGKDYPEGHETLKDIENREGKKKLKEEFRLGVVIRVESMPSREQGDDGERVSCSETIQELLAEPGMEPAQIAKMKTLQEAIDEGADAQTLADVYGVSPEAIVDEADRLGYETDEGGEMTIEEQIISMHEQGVEKSEIIDTLEVTHQKVGSVVRAWKAKQKQDQEVVKA